MKKLQKNLFRIAILAIATLTLVACGGEPPQEPNPSIKFTFEAVGLKDGETVNFAGTAIMIRGDSILKDGKEIPVPEVREITKTSTNNEIVVRSKEDNASPNPYDIVFVTLPESIRNQWVADPDNVKAVTMLDNGENNYTLRFIRKTDSTGTTPPDLAGAAALLKVRHEGLTSKTDKCKKLNADSSISELEKCVTDLKASMQETNTHKQTVNQLIAVMKGIDPDHKDIKPAQDEEGNADRAIGAATELIAKLQRWIDDKRQTNPNKVDLAAATTKAKAAREALEKKQTECSKLDENSDLDAIKACRSELSNLARALIAAEINFAKDIADVKANDPSNSDLSDAEKEMKNLKAALDANTSLLQKLDAIVRKIENSNNNTGNNTGTVIIRCLDDSKQPLSGCAIKEVTLDWNAIGTPQPSCTTKSDGTCRFENLPLNVKMEFAADANGYYGKNVNQTLTNSVPSKVDVLLQKQSSVAKFSCTSLLIKKGDSQTLDCHQEDGNGKKTLVTSSMTCSSSDKAIATVSSDCRKVTAVAKGCAVITITYGGKSWKSGIRTYESLSSLPSCTPPTNP